MDFKQKLKDAEEVFFESIRDIQDEIRTQLIAPFCDKYSMTFDSGMGGFCFEHEVIGRLFVEEGSRHSYFASSKHGWLEITPSTISDLKADNEFDNMSGVEIAEIELAIAILDDPDFKILEKVLTVTDPSNTRVAIGANVPEYLGKV